MKITTLLLAVAALGVAAAPAVAHSDHRYREYREHSRDDDHDGRSRAVAGLRRAADRLDAAAERLEDAARRASRGIHPYDRRSVRYAADRFEDAARDFRRAVHRRPWDAAALARRLARVEARYGEMLEASRLARPTRGLAVALDVADAALADARATVHRRAAYRPARPYRRPPRVAHRYPRSGVVVAGEVFFPGVRIGVVLHDD